MTDLDTLLSAPLASVDDAGFSARVTQQVAQQQSAWRERREIIEWSVLLVAGCIFLAVLPLQALSNVIEYIVVSLGTSAPITLAVGTIVLTFTYLRSTERT